MERDGTAVFSKNRDRLLTHDVAQQFFAAAMHRPRAFMSDLFHWRSMALLMIRACGRRRSEPKKKDGNGRR
jgi:hypothetical protein